MDRPYILHMLSPLKHVSPFDVNMALDAGFNAVVPYTEVAPEEVKGLVQDAIFSRGPKGVKRSGLFIGGRDAGVALDMLEAAQKAMFPPFQMSVFADPAGSFTTAAAMVACVESTLKERFDTDLKDERILVFGATGVVGYCAGVIAGGQGAKVTLVGYDGPTRVERAAGDAERRFGVGLDFADGSSDERKSKLLQDAEVVLCAGRAGVQVLSRAHLDHAKRLQVAADVNAVPPPGIEGLDAQHNGDALAQTSGVGIGALAIGAIKYQVESGLFKRMIESEKPLALDFRQAFDLARSLVA